MLPGFCHQATGKAADRFPAFAGRQSRQRSLSVAPHRNSAKERDDVRNRNILHLAVIRRPGDVADSAAGVFGGDLLSLAAYLGDLRQAEAARGVAGMLGIDAHE